MTATAKTLTHAKRVERVLWGVFILNLIVAAAKFSYGVYSNSASMQADGIHSVFDSLGNIIGLVSIRLAARPADQDHPYGHSKFETYGSLVIGVLLLVAAFEVGSEAIGKLQSGNYNADVTIYSFVVMIGTLLINLGVTIFEHRKGNQLHSEILHADASHTMSDAFVSIGVVFGLALVALGFPAADPIMALIVTVAIVISAINVFRAALRTLSDTARIPSHEIVRTVSSIPGIVNVHNVRTRGTEAEIYCDIHIIVDPDMTVRDAHRLADKAEDAIKEAYPDVKDVLVHVEPVGYHGDKQTIIKGQEYETMLPAQEKWLLTKEGERFLSTDWEERLREEQRLEQEMAQITAVEKSEGVTAGEQSNARGEGNVREIAHESTVEPMNNIPESEEASGKNIAGSLEEDASERTTNTMSAKLEGNADETDENSSRNANEK